VSRRIITSRLQAKEDVQLDNYGSRVVKYVPGDVIAAWLAVSGLLAGRTTAKIGVLWAVFGVLIVITPISVLRATRVKGLPPARAQAMLSTAAFAVWVFAIGQPFSHYSFYDASFGGVAIILFTLVSGLIDPEKVDKHVSSEHKAASAPGRAA
jgi:hypothetical protein